MSRARAFSGWNNSRVFDFLMEMLLLLVVFVMPAIFDRRLGIVFSGTKTTWMRVLGAVILGLWAIKLIVGRKHRFVRTPLDWPVASFLLCTTVATLTSLHVYTSFVGFYGRYEGLTSWYLFGLFFFVATNYIKDFDQLKRMVMTVISAATLMAVYSIIQRHALDPYMWGGVITWQRVIGTIGQPNFLAAYMLMAFYMILAMFLMEKEWKLKDVDWFEQLLPVGYFVFAQAAFLAMIYSLDAHNFMLWYFGFAVVTASALLFSYSYQQLHPWIYNIILGASLLLIYVCILYTQSRGGYMGLFTGAALFAVVAGRHWLFESWKKIGVLGFLIVLVSGITMANPEFSPFARFTAEIKSEKVEVEEKVETKLEFGGAAGSRGETWDSAIRIIADNPVFGIGPEVLKMVFPRYETELFRFKEAFHVKQDRCHNETLDVAVTKGLVTFFVYLWLLYTFFAVGFRKAVRVGHDQRLLLAGLLGSALAFLIQNQFSFGVVAITSLFWISWAMVMVVGEEKDKDEDKGKEINWGDIPWLPVAGAALAVAFLIYISFFSFRGDIWFKRGKTSMQMRRIPQAAEAFERSLAVFPLEGSTVSHLGIAYLNLSRMTHEQGKYLGKAVEALNYGTLIDPYNADNFYMLSKIYLMKGDLDAAERYADIALKIDPYYAEVYHTKGLALEARGRLAEAVSYHEKAFFINPNLVEPMQRLDYVNRKRGMPNESLKVFVRLHERYSDNITVLDRLARLYIERGMNARALQVAQDMLAIDPKNATGYIIRAEVRLRRGDLKGALSDFQQVIINDPRHVGAHLGMGRVYLLAGDQAKARDEFEQVLMLDPNNAYAKKMLGK